MPHAIDVAAQVAHCAVRTYVMGERGARNEPATADDIARMAAIVREGLEAGAIGFSTSRTQLHRTRDGEVMPGTYADEAELLGIGKVLGETGKGVYQLVSDWDEWEKEMDWMKRLSISTGGRSASCCSTAPTRSGSACSASSSTCARPTPRARSWCRTWARAR